MVITRIYSRCSLISRQLCTSGSSPSMTEFPYHSPPGLNHISVELSPIIEELSLLPYLCGIVFMHVCSVPLTISTSSNSAVIFFVIRRLSFHRSDFVRKLGSILTSYESLTPPKHSTNIPLKRSYFLILPSWVQ